MGIAVGVHPAFDDLDAIEISTDGVFEGDGHKAGGVCFVARSEFAAHGDAFPVAEEGGIAGGEIVVAEVPAAEEADHHAWAGRAVYFAAFDGVEDGGAGIFLGPNGGEAGGDELPAVQFCRAIGALHHDVFHAVGSGFVAGVFAEKVFFFGGGEGGVAVGRADEAGLVGIDAELGFDLEASLEGFATVFAGEHVVGFQF